MVATMFCIHVFVVATAAATTFIFAMMRKLPFRANLLLYSCSVCVCVCQRNPSRVRKVENECDKKENGRNGTDFVVSVGSWLPHSHNTPFVQKNKYTLPNAGLYGCGCSCLCCCSFRWGRSQFHYQNWNTKMIYNV